MLRLLLPILILLTTFCQAQDLQSLELFETSKKHSFKPLTVFQVGSAHCDTIIRNKPKGKVILTLDLEDYFSFKIVEIRGEWFKVIEVISVNDYDVKIPGKKGWIHNSDIGLATRKDVEILSSPINGVVLGMVEQEESVKIVDAHADWVKIEFEELVGWVHSEWFCGSPVTTCP